MKKRYCIAAGSLCLCLICFLLNGCEKEAGEGGTSSVRGKVYVMNYNSAGQLTGEYYAGEEHVYIIYGDAAYFGDDIKTSFDGTYQFDYLRKGSYTIFAYSKCDTCVSGQQAVMLTTEITENHSTINLPDIVIKN